MSDTYIAQHKGAYMDELQYVIYKWEKLSWWQQKVITTKVFLATIKNNHVAVATASGLLAAAVVYLAFQGGWAGVVGGFLIGYFVSTLQFFSN